MGDVTSPTNVILNHLVEQPNTENTFEGIAGWLVMTPEINAAIEKAAKALDLLASEGFVVVEEHGGKKYYKINENELPQIKRILQGNGGEMK